MAVKPGVSTAMIRPDIRWHRLARGQACDGPDSKRLERLEPTVTNGSDGGLSYSDMNRWGPFAHPFIYWKLYWGAFAILLAVLTNLLWIRGEETHARWRAQLARARFVGPV